MAEFQASTIKLLNNELSAAIEKHGRDQTPLNYFMPDSEKLIVLVEEVGEVARAMTYDEGDEEQLIAELVQVATMALAWAQGTREKR